MKFIFKYMFYVCTAFGIIQLNLMLINLIICIVSMSILWTNILSLASFVAYGITISHLFFLCLSRLYHTFHSSAYRKSPTFYTVITSIFATMILSSITGLILWLLRIQYITAILVTVAAFGYLVLSVLLLNVFSRQLLKLITHKVMTIRFRSKRSLRDKTESLDLTFTDQLLVDCISKYLVLGIASFTTSLLVLIWIFLHFFILFGDIYGEILKCVIVVDVINNILMYISSI
eukprot:UN11204